MRVCAGYGNAPTNRCARDAEIAKTAFDEAKNFIAPRFRLNEIRVLLVKIQKRLLKSGKLEEIVFFGDRLSGPAAIRAILPRFYVYVGVVVDAVLTGVVAGVNKSVFAEQI